MTNSSKQNEGLLDETSRLKRRIQELEVLEADRKRAEQELTIIAEIGRMIDSVQSASAGNAYQDVRWLSMEA